MGVLSALKLKDYITLVGTFLGFCAIVIAVFTEAFRAAFLFVLASTFFDLMDGYVARKTNQINELGKELDSLSDSLCFAIAPSIIIFRAYTLETTATGMPGWNPLVLLIPAFIFTVCGILRLAWFNIIKSDCYTGLMTPLSAGFLWLFHFVDYYSCLAFGPTVVNQIMHYLVPVVYIFIGWCNITDYICYGREVRKKEGGTKVKIMSIMGIMLIATVLSFFIEQYVSLIFFLMMAILFGYLCIFIGQGFMNAKRMRQEGIVITADLETGKEKEPETDTSNE